MKKIKDYAEAQFRRITGVKRKTFDKMVEILTTAEAIKKDKGGRPNKLSKENRLLMALEYLREYRTYAHIVASYGLSESNAYESIRWIEDTLIKSKEFSLPGRKAVTKSDCKYEIILIDAVESPIERTQKNSANITQERKKRHTQKAQVIVDKKVHKLFVPKSQMANAMISEFTRSQE